MSVHREHKFNLYNLAAQPNTPPSFPVWSFDSTDLGHFPSLGNPCSESFRVQLIYVGPEGVTALILRNSAYYFTVLI